MSIKKELEKLGEKITNKDIQGGTKEKLLKSITDNYNSAVTFLIDEDLFRQMSVAYSQNEGVELTEGTIFEQALEVAERIESGQIPPMFIRTEAKNPQDATQTVYMILTYRGTSIAASEDGKYKTESGLKFQLDIGDVPIKMEIDIDSQAETPKVTLYIK